MYKYCCSETVKGEDGKLYYVELLVVRNGEKKQVINSCHRDMVAHGGIKITWEKVCIIIFNFSPKPLV